MIYTRGGFYWYEFVFNGRRYRKTTDIKVGRGVPGEIPPKEKAKAIEASKRQKLAMEAAGIPQPEPSPIFSDFAKQFLKWVSSQRASKPNTVAFYRVRVGLLEKFDGIRNARLDEISGQVIAKYVEYRRGCARTKVVRRKSGLKFEAADHKVSVSGINRELAVLRRMLRVAREWGQLAAVPVIHLLPGEKQSDRILSHTEEDLYLTAAPLRLRQFATIALDTGMRPEEILRLRWEHAHFEPAGDARFGYLHNPYGKTAKARRNLPMTARVKGLLEMLHEEAKKPHIGYVLSDDGKEPVSYNAIKCQHERVVKRLKLAKFRLYDLRHSFLTRLGEAGADSFTIQKMAGHSSIIVSQRYVHPTEERVEEAVFRLDEYNKRKAEELRAKQRVS